MHCNSSLLKHSCWSINGNSRPNNSQNNKKVLNLSETAEVIYVSPNRLNLRFSVQKVKKEQQLKKQLCSVIQ